MLAPLARALLRSPIGPPARRLYRWLRPLSIDEQNARYDHETTPPHVEYRLTEEGLSLTPVLQALYDWGAARAARTGTPIEEPVAGPR